MAAENRVVVVVDDEPGFCDTVKDVLEDEGFTVEIARDGRAGLDLLRALPAPPCLVVLDILMPVLDGKEVYRELKADPKLANVPVVFATSDPSLVPTGAPVLAKPFSIDRLIATVASYCA